jgi:hypothetical protein
MGSRVRPRLFNSHFPLSPFWNGVISCTHLHVDCRRLNVFPRSIVGTVHKTFESLSLFTDTNCLKNYPKCPKIPFSPIFGIQDYSNSTKHTWEIIRTSLTLIVMWGVTFEVLEMKFLFLLWKCDFGKKSWDFDVDFDVLGFILDLV